MTDTRTVGVAKATAQPAGDESVGNDWRPSDPQQSPCCRQGERLDKAAPLALQVGGCGEHGSQLAECSLKPCVFPGEGVDRAKWPSST